MSKPIRGIIVKNVSILLKAKAEGYHSGEPYSKIDDTDLYKDFPPETKTPIRTLRFKKFKTFAAFAMFRSTCLSQHKEFLAVMPKSTIEPTYFKRDPFKKVSILVARIKRKLCTCPDESLARLILTRRISCPYHLDFVD